ncbi:Hypothetical protein I595_1389 [Croceitalea dokdonensis DOKDO 023]|uniref:Uncharacterized protein n=1 Tax=Croceitalea dokdonensis DOKDO 023 TaxID=1300341 RepID=A0A0P7AXP8_9FLAO|nr:Hypothetical protein I595_1389 [Croceitalea dokdonensis DOKDO 023]
MYTSYLKFYNSHSLAFYFWLVFSFQIRVSPYGKLRVTIHFFWIWG